MRTLLYLSGLVAIISCSAVDRPAAAREIGDMNSYLVQATCSGTLTPNNCAYADQTKDLITTPLAFRRLDWPGAYSGIVSDNVLDPGSGAVISTFKRLTENELSDFSRLWHDGCGKTIIEAQDVEQNHSPEV